MLSEDTQSITLQTTLNDVQTYVTKSRCLPQWLPSDFSDNGAKLRCFAIKLCAKGVTTCSQFLDVMQHCMPYRRKRKRTHKDKITRENDEISEVGKGWKTNQNDSHPKMMKSRFFNFQRPGCSSDDCLIYPCTIYLPDGEEVLPKNCQLFAKDDGSPPPNCNPFDSAASFMCLSVSKEIENDQYLDYTFQDTDTSSQLSDRTYCCSDNNVLTRGRTYDCRKLANSCFSSHSRWSSCLYGSIQEAIPNPVVYVPKRSSSGSNDALQLRTVFRKILYPKCEDSIDLDWAMECQEKLKSKHVFSTASIGEISDYCHSTAFLLL